MQGHTTCRHGLTCRPILLKVTEELFHVRVKTAWLIWPWNDDNEMTEVSDAPKHPWNISTPANIYPHVVVDYLRCSSTVLPRLQTQHEP